MSSVVAARSVLSITWMQPAGMPAPSAAAARTRARATQELMAMEPPLSTQALPVFTHRPAVSAVTLGLAS